MKKTYISPKLEWFAPTANHAASVIATSDVLLGTPMGDGEANDIIGIHYYDEEEY